MEGIEFKQTLQFGNEFFNEKGWGREPFTHTLQIPGEVFGVFPPPDPSKCITAFDKKSNNPIGYVATNQWNIFTKQILENIETMKKKYTDGNVLKFLNVLEIAIKKELELLPKKFQELNITDDLVLHSCGLMVLDAYGGKGIATHLYKEREEIVKGYKAIVVETTNIASAKVAKANGFELVHSIDYKSCDIPLDDMYSIWVKIL
jgi:hypothetical protein